MIPVNEPLLGQRELDNVRECLQTGWISSAGRFIDLFEQNWARYCGMKYGIAVSNGTTALQVAARCLDLKPGDEVIMPAFTISWPMSRRSIFFLCLAPNLSIID